MLHSDCSFSSVKLSKPCVFFPMFLAVLLCLSLLNLGCSRVGLSASFGDISLSSWLTVEKTSKKIHNLKL